LPGGLPIKNQTEAMALLAALGIIGIVLV